MTERKPMDPENRDALVTIGIIILVVIAIVLAPAIIAVLIVLAFFYPIWMVIFAGLASNHGLRKREKR